MCSFWCTGGNRKATCKNRLIDGRIGFFRTGLQTIGIGRRKKMVIQKHEKLSIRTQCRLLKLNRSSFYQATTGESLENINLMKLIDDLYLQHPTYGSRRIQYMLKAKGKNVGRHRVRRLMQKMGIQAIYQKPKTSLPNQKHKIYPYLLKNLIITSYDDNGDVNKRGIKYSPTRNKEIDTIYKGIHAHLCGVIPSISPSAKHSKH